MAEKIGDNSPSAVCPPRPAAPIATGSPIGSTALFPFAPGALDVEPFTRPRLDEDGGDDE